MKTLLLIGLRADNLLAYLAALGTLRVATLQEDTEAVRMSWDFIEGSWRPYLHYAREIDRKAFVQGLHKQLQSGKNLRAFQLGNNLNLTLDSFRKALEQCVQSASLSDRRDVDFLAAFGSDAIATMSGGKRTNQIADTAFRTMSGGGHQHFLGTIRTFIEDTTEEHLEKSLFADWTYDDPIKKHTMRWDPMDDIRYALRWDDPSGDKNREQYGSMWGANRLAIEALPFFPTQPIGGRLATTGFAENRAREVTFTWPVWSPPIGLMELRSLLCLSDLQAEIPDREKLRSRGVVEIYRCQRITQDKFRNFTPATPA
jgi:hypothetical protein